MLQNMYKKAAGLWVELRVELLSAIEYYAEDKVNSAQIWRLYWASHQVIPFFLCNNMLSVGGNNGCIPPTLEGWVYIIPIHGPLDGPLYTWAQYTPTVYTFPE